MQFKLPTYWLALGLVICLAVWLANGDIERAQDEAPATSVSKIEVPKVAFQTLQAQAIQREVTLQGQVEPLRSITLQARLDSFVESLLVNEGARLQSGQLLLTLNEEDLPAKMQEAKALVALAQSELQAALSLAKRGLLADTERKSKEANLATAKARVAKLEQDQRDIRVVAPFAGVVEQRHVEQGESVYKGTPLLALLDDSKVKLVGQVPQQEIGGLQLGMQVNARLLGGEQLQGILTFISRQADPTTRTFKVEAELENPQQLRVIGATATLQILTGEVYAHNISPALLELDHQGRLSIEHLTNDDRVMNTPVQRVKATNTELWVAGLPRQARVITLGKGYVLPGQQVEAVPEQEIMGASN